MFCFLTFQLNLVLDCYLKQSGLPCEIRIRHGGSLIPAVITACGDRSAVLTEDYCPLPVIGYTLGNESVAKNMWERLRSNSLCAVVEAAGPVRGVAPGQAMAVYQA